MEKSLAKMACIVFVFCAATAINSPATTTFKTLANFDGTNGANPEYMSLVQGADGNYYGTTSRGGANKLGTVFKITAGGTLTTLYSFCPQTGCPDGSYPYAGLVQATDGNFYGTTLEGGANKLGTVFKITAGGTLTTLYSFCSQTNCTDGSTPWAGLVQGADGNFYGALSEGGANNLGTVFKITKGGKLITLHSFDYTDGANPVAGLVQATNGDFYGTASVGGATGNGTVFKITTRGKLTTLHSFDGSDGSYPFAGLVQATNGDLYGTTHLGGATGNGTVFKITTGGKLTTLRSFDGSDGTGPSSTLVETTCGDFYGTTYQGGNLACNAPYGCGTVFKITRGAKLTTLHSFDSTDGATPWGGLVQGTDGNFYGTTFDGGTSSTCSLGLGGCGTVFGLSVGLAPFVETKPTSGKVGAAVIILGTDLTGATSVSFNGTAATFTVVSSSEIKTTIPAGATTGTVEVATPSGKLKSNVVFRVTPQVTSFSPTSDPVGTVVTITGVSLEQTTHVTFGGVKATTFTVVSDSEVTADVPTGAITGEIAVTTAGGTVSSSGTFTVTGGKCTPQGAQCPPQRPPCCPGLTCVPASTRAFCEPAGSTRSSGTDSFFNQVNMDKLQ